MDKEVKHVEMSGLASYMEKVIRKLEEDKKHAAVHTYSCTLNSFTEFSAGEKVLLVTEVFTPGRLKEYET